MIRTSLILNTACLDPLVQPNANPFRQRTYASRKELLESTINQAKHQFDEIIVAGTFQPGDGYTYVEVQPRFHDRRDALYQREYGARHSTGDVLVFCHDDHAPAEDFGVTLRDVYCTAEWTDWDLLVPCRRHSLTGETLNNGKDDGYMGGHCLVMKRWLWAEVPWVIVDTEWWDTSMTRIWREAGATILWVDDLVHLDLEAAENER